MSLIPLPESLIPFLQSYLPPQRTDKIHVTLTYAQSLDARIAEKPGIQTKLSHVETKTMTHYLRSKHDAILVGIGTVLADDPKLNCRYEIDHTVPHHPRPIIVDPQARWKYQGSNVSKVYNAGLGKAPYIIVAEGAKIDPESEKAVQLAGGQYIRFPVQPNGGLCWHQVLTKLHDLDIQSIMIEGGAHVIDGILKFHKIQPTINSLIITIAPVYLGKNGVEVSPCNRVDLVDAEWWTGLQDSVLAARVS
ncbi:RIB7 [[Candida] subhashii]|uniref:RIB7 n=1 Tax=[Candida] subhashii TaxID=561895 RepID=A0A8J5Q885_9ASCO|nr:RIB7 [[Candida] subhashii]KAG7662789.1 RIB7 [[Candida] subhashii]